MHKLERQRKFEQIVQSNIPESIKDLEQRKNLKEYLHSWTELLLKCEQIEYSDLPELRKLYKQIQGTPILNRKKIYQQFISFENHLLTKMIDLATVNPLSLNEVGELTAESSTVTIGGIAASNSERNENMTVTYRTTRRARK